jgi:hypothetical protein
MWRKDWVRQRIRCHSGPTTAAAWIMALLWNGFVWPVLLILWGDPDKRIMVKVLTLFCLAGLGLLVWAVRSTLVWFRFGTSVFELASNPGVIGGTIEGVIQTRLRARPKGTIQVRLSCVRRRKTTSSGSGGGTSITTEPVWQGGRRVPPGQLAQGPRGLSIPVRIQIPFDLPSSDTSDPSEQIIWKLGVSGDLRGVDFDAEFHVPVFVTEDSRPELTEETVDETAEEQGLLIQPLERDPSWVPPVVVRPGGDGGVEYVFRPAVPLKVAVGVSLLTVAVCAGSAWLWVWLEEAGPFALLPAVLGVLLILATAVVWTFESRVLIERGRVKVRKSVLWIPRTRSIPFSDIKSVIVRREVVEGLKEKDRDWELVIDRYTGEQVDLGASIASRADAVRIADEMESLIS